MHTGGGAREPLNEPFELARRYHEIDVVQHTCKTFARKLPTPAGAALSVPDLSVPV